MLHDVTIALFNAADGSTDFQVMQVDAAGGDDAASKAAAAVDTGGRPVRIIGVAPSAVQPVAEVEIESEAPKRRGRPPKVVADDAGLGE